MALSDNTITMQEYMDARALDSSPADTDKVLTKKVAEDLKYQPKSNFGGSVNLPIIFWVPGNLYVKAKIQKRVAEQDGTFVRLFASLETASTGANFILDIKKNGTTILTTPLVITATTTSASTTGFDITTFLADDEIELHITLVGSTVTGAGLAVALKYSI